MSISARSIHELLDIHHATVDLLIRKDKLKASKDKNGKYNIEIEDFIAFLNMNPSYYIRFLNTKPPKQVQYLKTIILKNIDQQGSSIGDRYYTVRDINTIFNRSMPAIQTDIRKGYLHAVKNLDNRYIIKGRDIVSYIIHSSISFRPVNSSNQLNPELEKLRQYVIKNLKY